MIGIEDEQPPRPTMLARDDLICVGADRMVVKMEPAQLLDVAERILEKRRLRDDFFDRELFGEPVFEILLYLFVSAIKKRAVSQADACAVAGVPCTSGMRYVSAMIAEGLVVHTSRDVDARRRGVTLSPTALDNMTRYLTRCAAL